MEKNKETKTLSPKLDVVFQALFGEIGNERITKGFLETILKRKIEREYENNIAEYEKDMQVYKEYNNNRNINEDLLIKMQKATSKDEAFEFSLKILENCLNDSSLSRRIFEKFQNWLLKYAMIKFI